MAKRKYTFRKGKAMPYRSGSLLHMAEKGEREFLRENRKRMKKLI